MKILAILGIVIIVTVGIALAIIFGGSLWFSHAVKQGFEETISLKGRYEGVPEVPDTKPFTAMSYDSVRLSDLSNLQPALGEFFKQSPTRSFPMNAQEYLTLTKYLTISGGKLPKDLITNNDYCYTVDPNGKSYTITTILQSAKYAKEKNNTEVSQTCTFPEGMKVICSPAQKCYQVGSP